MLQHHALFLPARERSPLLKRTLNTKWKIKKNRHLPDVQQLPIFANILSDRLCIFWNNERGFLINMIVKHDSV